MFNFEKKYVPDDEILQGIISDRWMRPLNILFFILASGSLYFSDLIDIMNIDYKNIGSVMSLSLLLFIGIITSRLLVLDLRYYILPDVYTITLLILGLLTAPLLYDNPTMQGYLASFLGAVIGIVLMLTLAFLMEWLRGGNIGLGGGDIKLIGAAGAWLGAFQLSSFLFIACIISLIFTIRIPKGSPIPFGPGLCISFWIMLLYGQQVTEFIIKLL